MDLDIPPLYHPTVPQIPTKSRDTARATPLLAIPNQSQRVPGQDLRGTFTCMLCNGSHSVRHCHLLEDRQALSDLRAMIPNSNERPELKVGQLYRPRTRSNHLLGCRRQSSG